MILIKCNDSLGDSQSGNETGRSRTEILRTFVVTAALCMSFPLLISPLLFTLQLMLLNLTREI